MRNCSAVHEGLWRCWLCGDLRNSRGCHYRLLNIFRWNFKLQEEECLLFRTSDDESSVHWISVMNITWCKVLSLSYFMFFSWTSFTFQSFLFQPQHILDMCKSLNRWFFIYVCMILCFRYHSAFYLACVYLFQSIHLMSSSNYYVSNAFFKLYSWHR